MSLGYPWKQFQGSKDTDRKFLVEPVSAVGLESNNPLCISLDENIKLERINNVTRSEIPAETIIMLGGIVEMPFRKRLSVKHIFLIGLISFRGFFRNRHPKTNFWGIMQHDAVPEPFWIQRVGGFAKPVLPRTLSWSKCGLGLKASPSPSYICLLNT